MSIVSTNEDIYYLRKSHIISPKDEFIDLTGDEWERALVRTRQLWERKNKDGEPSYPNGEIVRNEIRSPQIPLLLIYFLDPEGAALPIDSEPIVGYAISFPRSEFNASVRYAVHEQLLSLFDIEDNSDEREDENED